MFDQFSVQLSPKEPLPFLVKLSVWSWLALCNWSWPTWCKEIDLGLRCCHVLQDPVQVQMDQKSQADLGLKFEVSTDLKWLVLRLAELVLVAW